MNERINGTLSTDIQHIKREKNIILGSFWCQGHLYTHLEAKKQKKEVSICLYLRKKKRTSSIYDKKFRIDGIYIHISQSKHLLLQCRKERIEEHAKRHKKYKHKIQIILY